MTAPAAPVLDETEEARFLAFLSAQQRTLYKVAYIYCRDPEDRRDLMQDMAIQLWRAFDRFDGRSAPSTWTWRVAMNVAISHRRREGRRLRDGLPLDFAMEIADGAFDTDSVQSRELRALIDTLDEVSRAVVLLHLEGFEHTEIGEMLGASPGAIATRINRIKTRLQNQYAEGVRP